MSSKTSKKAPQNNRTFSNAPELKEMLEQVLSHCSNGRPFSLIVIRGNLAPSASGCMENPGRRCLLVFQGLPIHTRTLQIWRTKLTDKGVVDLRIAITETSASEEEFIRLVQNRCADWLSPAPEKETRAVSRGSRVRMTDTVEKHDPSLLTMMFGTMGELLNRVDLLAKRYRDICRIDDCSRVSYVDGIRKMLKEGAGNPADLQKLQADITRLPRVLLLGETGVGKTLFARHLSGGTDRDANNPFRKVFIPEWLNKEDALEYDLFGYSKGAYTGGKIEGDVGEMLTVVGGVVFLDEIGTASPFIQAKLLGFMDDYKVKPKGWSNGAFECPILVVAATNRTLEELKADKFRPDLLARFTDIIQIPPLRKRRDDFEFILDCLLQNLDINPSSDKAVSVEEIGADALGLLRKQEFPGNFRQLENVLRSACAKAVSQDRDYVCKQDVEDSLKEVYL